MSFKISNSSLSMFSMVTEDKRNTFYSRMPLGMPSKYTRNVSVWHWWWNIMFNFIARYHLQQVSFVDVLQWLAACRWFSTGTPVSSTNKIDRHDITEILLKVPLTHHNPNPNRLCRKLLTQFVYILEVQLNVIVPNMIIFLQINQKMAFSVINYVDNFPESPNFDF
jgi:hypothetical protein